jgi:hypothetical protein
MAVAIMLMLMMTTRMIEKPFSAGVKGWLCIPMVLLQGYGWHLHCMQGFRGRPHSMFWILLWFGDCVDVSRPPFFVSSDVVPTAWVLNNNWACNIEVATSGYPLQGSQWSTRCLCDVKKGCTWLIIAKGGLFKSSIKISRLQS